MAVDSTTEYTSLILMLATGVTNAFASLRVIWCGRNKKIKLFLFPFLEIILLFNTRVLSSCLTDINRRLAALEGRGNRSSSTSAIFGDNAEALSKSTTRLFKLYALFVPLPPLAFAAVFSFYNDEFDFAGRMIIG